MKGLKLPVGVNKMGGSAIVEDLEHEHKILSTILGDNDSEHAYQQDLGLGSAMVFDISSPTIRAKILNRLYFNFKRLQELNLYKLKRNTIKWDEDAIKQELILEFKYINLETDEESTFRKAFSKTS